MPEPPSLKERHFHLVGETFLFQSGYLGFFLETKLLPHYPEILQSWQAAVSAYDTGTPTKKFASASPAEQDQLELFFIELKHGQDPPADVLRKYAAFYQAKINDPAFIQAVDKTIKSRNKFVTYESDLVYKLLEGWVYGFLWGLTNPDRATLLEHSYGLKVNSSDAAGLVKKTVQRLKLDSWSDFRQSYLESPFILRLWTPGEHGGKHGACQILLRSRGLLLN
jgi:hypothetical protein